MNDATINVRLAAIIRLSKQQTYFYSDNRDFSQCAAYGSGSSPRGRSLRQIRLRLYVIMKQNRGVLSENAATVGGGLLIRKNEPAYRTGERRERERENIFMGSAP